VEFQLNLSQNVRLVLFDRDLIIALRVHDLLAQITLTEHRIAHDDPPLQYHLTQQIQSRLVLVGLLVHTTLTEHATRLMIDH
jgi:hypothetical protein